MADIGYGALLLTFICAGYGLVALLVGLRRRYAELIRSAENALALAAIWTIAASGVLMYLLLQHDYSVRYVYEHVSSTMALQYVLSAFWAGQEGSLLLWLLLVAVSSLILHFSLRDDAGRTLRPYVLATMALVEAFLALVLILPSNPFGLMDVVVSEGFGLNPLLENWGMIFHPPTLFIGYALYTIPFAFVLAGLLSRQPSDVWMERARRWSLLAWMFLGVGILLGAWWAYVELGWGGYWGWDPVENSSLIPWLVGTAALHSAAIQRRRGIFRVWTAGLTILTFGLCVFATFVTRSGVIQSVHAFGRSSIGTYFGIFLVATMAGGFALLWARRRALASDQALESLVSREAGFLATNLLLVGAALVVLLGTIFPAVTELLQGRQVALGPSFFNRAFSPLGLATILLFGICPLLGWRNTSLSRLGRRLAPAGAAAAVALVALVILGIREPLALIGFTTVAFVGSNILAEFVRGALARRRSTGENPASALVNLVSRDRRRYGGMIVHLSMLLILLGVVGSAAFKQESQVALAPGEEVQLGAYTIRYVEPVRERLPAKQRFAAAVDVYRDGQLVKQLMPEKNFHWNIEQWVSEVSVWSGAKEDLYMILAGMQDDGLATFQILINPLMIWMWIGGGVLVLGSLVAWLPEPRRQVATVSQDQAALARGEVR